MRMRKLRATIALALASLGLMAAPGCGGGGPALVNVTGTVTQSNKPLEGAAIIFLPDASSDDARPAESITDAGGNYTLRTGDQLGAVPGKYRVVITPRLSTVEMAKVDPAFADDPYMANLSLHGDPTAFPRKGKAAPKPTEHSEDREITAGANQVHDFDVKLKAAE